MNKIRSGPVQHKVYKRECSTDPREQDEYFNIMPIYNCKIKTNEKCYCDGRYCGYYLSFNYILTYKEEQNWINYDEAICLNE